MRSVTSFRKTYKLELNFTEVTSDDKSENGFDTEDDDDDSNSDSASDADSSGSSDEDGSGSQSGSSHDTDDDDDEDGEAEEAGTLGVLPSFVWNSKEEGMRELNKKPAGTYVVFRDRDALRIEYRRRSRKDSTLKTLGHNVLATSDGGFKLDSKSSAKAGPFRSLDELLEANKDRLMTRLCPSATRPDYGEYGGKEAKEEGCKA